jgi:hypothetical protein
MGMVTFICRYEPCSKEVTYLHTFPGRRRRYCSQACRSRNRSTDKAALAEMTKRFAERHAEFRAEGLCVKCGAAVEEGRLHCYDHLLYYRQYQRERRKKVKRA